MIDALLFFGAALTAVGLLIATTADAEDSKGAGSVLAAIGILIFVITAGSTLVNEQERIDRIINTYLPKVEKKAGEQEN